MSQASFVQPPRIAAWLVDLFTPVKQAESIPGDLLEEFLDLTSKLGVARARRWYWRQSLKTIAHLIGTEGWLLAQPAPPDAGLLPPEGSLFRMQYRLVREIAAIRDPAYAPAMERLLDLPGKDMREEVLQGLRTIASQQAKLPQEQWAPHI